MERDLTKGSVLKTIGYFALPYLFSYFLQTLYGMADLFIIGQFNGVDSITAVSNGSQIMHMITVIIVGLAMGTTVTIGKAIGARKKKDVSLAVGNTVSLFLGLSVLFTVLLVLFVNPIIQLVGIPMEAIGGAKQYLIICFIGIPFITAYNIISSIYRGLGDSKTPMYIITFACVINILLDYLFMGIMNLSAVGAALGTTLSQTLSVMIALVLIKKSQSIQLQRQDFILHKDMMSEILRIGIPVALQDGLIQVAFIIITIIANYRGLNDAAAVGIVEKIISFLFIVPSSMLATVSALGSHNVGANKHERAKQILTYALVITITYGCFVSVLIEIIIPDLMKLFTNDIQVITLGIQYMRSYVVDSIFAGIHFCFTGYFCAYGKSYIGFIHNIVAIVVARVPGAYFTSLYFPNTLFPMGMAAPAGSIISVIICFIAYSYYKKQGEFC